MQTFTSRMCACADRPCADVVQTDMTRWSQSLAARDTSEAKPTEAEMKQMTEIGQHYGECMAKLYRATP